ncbi:MAG: dTDP-4-dehydrorhamnose 3,5-epimerase [Sphingobacteriales bacterium]
MPFHATEFPDLFLVEPKVHEDRRGYFFESYNEADFKAAGLHYTWVQDNQSKSGYGVVRGLHFQAEPHTQSKLVRVLSGIIWDVVVDLRKGSPTYGKSYGVELSSENKLQILVPKGFAHGFSVLSETVEVLYKCDTLYHKESEQGIMFNDPDLNIEWRVPQDKMIISEKDLHHPLFRDNQHNFTYRVD